jgi:hypothetical protein
MDALRQCLEGLTEKFNKEGLDRGTKTLKTLWAYYLLFNRTGYNQFSREADFANYYLIHDGKRYHVKCAKTNRILSCIYMTLPDADAICKELNGGTKHAGQGRKKRAPPHQ